MILVPELSEILKLLAIIRSPAENTDHIKILKVHLSDILCCAFAVFNLNITDLLTANAGSFTMQFTIPKKSLCLSID